MKDKITSREPVAKKESSVSQKKKTDTSHSINSPIENILQLHKTLGNQAVQKLIKSGGVQTKLKIGQPDDKYEQEADHVAKQVMRMPEPDVQQRVIPEESKKQEEGLLQTKEQSNRSGVDNPDAGCCIESMKGNGRPLPDSTRSYFESRFGSDFSDVRLHTDTQAAQAARVLNARAFTTGRDIVFGSGEFAPETEQGRKLIGHELSHVVQQSSAGRAVQLKEKETKSEKKMDLFDRIGFFVLNPLLQTGAIKTALQELNATYAPHVKLDEVVFRKLKTADFETSGDLFQGAQSHWEGKTPVIELGESVIRDFETYESDPEVNRHNGHRFIRILGHEMYHLYRAKIKHVRNPLQPLFEAEYRRRMRKVRQDWIEDLKVKRPDIKKWKDIPEKERKGIEKGAAETDMFKGLYFRTAYLVEEIYAKIEELSFLRIEQRLEPGAEKVTRVEVSILAGLVYKIWNRLDSLSKSGVEFLTPEHLEKTQKSMETYLQKRYGKGKRETYELRFFKSAIKHGLPPLR